MLNNLFKVTQLGSGGSHLFSGHNDPDSEILEFHGFRKYKIPQPLRSWQPQIPLI